MEARQPAHHGMSLLSSRQREAFVLASLALSSLLALSMLAWGAGTHRQARSKVDAVLEEFDLHLPEVPGRLPEGMKDALQDVKKDLEEDMTVRDVINDVAADLKKDMPAVRGDIPQVFGNLTLPEGLGISRGLETLKKLQKYSKEVEPEGTSSKDQRWMLARILAFIAVCTGAGYLVEVCPWQLAPSKRRPRACVVAFTAATYVLLIPGIFSILFSFVIAVQITGPLTPFGSIDFHVTVTQDAETHEPAAITESMMSVTRMLFKGGNVLGGSLVALYAFVIPLAKMILLVLGEVWRHNWASGAQACVRTVQVVSKWACPDLFAYVLLLHLVRALPEECELIQSAGHLDVGFACFSIFCVCSTFASLWIPLPSSSVGFTPLSGGEGEEEQRLRPDAAQPSVMLQLMPGTELERSKMLNKLGRRNIFWAELCLAMTSAGLLAAGVLIPCMGLQLHNGSLVQPVGPLPPEALPFLEELDLESQVHSRVTIWDCMSSLLQFALAGNCNSGLAWVIFAVFVIGFTLLDLAFLVITVNLLVFPTSPLEKEVGVQRSQHLRPWALAHILQHTSMLGPAIMGVVVTCMAADNFKKQGVDIFMLPGLFVLFLAELCHYAAYLLAESAIGCLGGGSLEPGTPGVASLAAWTISGDSDHQSPARAP